MAEDQELDDYYIALINQKMAGIKVANRLYGWIAYFQAMTDIYYWLLAIVPALSVFFWFIANLS